MRSKGAVCSALMAVSHISNETPLIIANSDQIFEGQLEELISQFKDSDAGVVTFESVHPRWSYVRLDEKQRVIETAEKRPISRHAIAGLYYFKHGSDFVTSAMRTIEKDSSFNGNFYISSTLNEMILMDKTVGIANIEAGKYHTFYTPKKIEEYEAKLSRR